VFPKRMGRADEFGHLVRMLIENDYMNAEVVRFDGGIRFQSKLRSAASGCYLTCGNAFLNDLPRQAVPSLGRPVPSGIRGLAERAVDCPILFDLGVLGYNGCRRSLFSR